MLIRKNYSTGKKVALESVSTENEAKEWIDLASSRVCLIYKVKNAKMLNIDEIIFYLKSQYLTHNEEPRTFIWENKGRYLGNMSFLVHAKIVFVTFLENKRKICTYKF